MITFQIFHTGLFFPFPPFFNKQNQFPLKILEQKLTSEKQSPKRCLYSSDFAECRVWLQHLRLVYQSRLVFMVYLCFCFTSTFVHIQTQKNPTKGSSSFKYIEWYQNSLSLDISSSDKYTYVYICNIYKYSPDTMKHINYTLLSSNNTTNQKTQLLLWIVI